MQGYARWQMASAPGPADAETNSSEMHHPGAESGTVPFPTPLNPSTVDRVVSASESDSPILTRPYGRILSGPETDIRIWTKARLRKKEPFRKSAGHRLMQNHTLGNCITQFLERGDGRAFTASGPFPAAASKRASC
jgi:hypothetical protein